MDYSLLSPEAKLVQNKDPNHLKQLFSDILSRGCNYFVKSFYSRINIYRVCDRKFVTNIEDIFLQTIETFIRKRYLTLKSRYDILFTSIYLNHIKILKLILEDSEIDPSALNNEAIIEACNNGYTEIVRLLLQDPRVDPSDRNSEVILQLCKNGYTEITQLLLQDGRIDPSICDNEAIKLACTFGHLEIVELLLQDPRVDPSAQNNAAIIDTIPYNGEIFKLLLQDPRLDPSVPNNIVIIQASWCGDIKAVKLLLQDPRVDPSDQNNEALMQASTHGNVKVVELLLKDPRVDPAARNNEALMQASEHGNVKIVELLLKDPRVDPAARHNEALVLASRTKHSSINRYWSDYIGVMRLLLQDSRVDPSAQNNTVITYSSKYGETEIMKILLQDPRVDPSDQNNKAIFWAYRNARTEAIKLLLQDTRVSSTVNFDVLRKSSVDDDNSIFEFYIGMYTDEESTDSYADKRRGTIKYINEFLFKQYLDSKVDEKTSIYITNYFKENMPDDMYKKDEIDKIFEDYFRQFKDKIITIQRWYSEIYYRPDNLGARLAKQRFEENINITL